MTSAMLDIAETASRAGRILDEVERAVVGKRAALELVLIGLLADGHVLIEDYPGLAKTVIARSFAHVMGLGFARIQFTPDLMPADVTSASVYDQRTGSFQFRPGPVFTNLLLADEINRTPPKTQAALLEAMQERQVTVEGTTHPLKRPFLVVATQNPIEYEGTYPLPEAQLDRFLLRVRVGYPARTDEWRILAGRIQRASDDFTLRRVTDPAGVLALQASLEQVHVAEPVGYYMVDLVGATRADRNLEVGASPRGGLALLRLAAPRPPWPAATGSPPTTSSRSPCPPWRTASLCGPSCGSAAWTPTRSSATCSTASPTPAAEDLPDHRP